jgi:hypothetical protein
VKRPGAIAAVASAALLVLATGPARATTLDEVLARHERARGGKARWEAVRSLVLEGEQETFSESSPFTLVRAQPGRMRWEYAALGNPVVIAWNGDSGWWIEPLFGPWPTPLPTMNRKILARDARIVPPLLSWRENGDRLELVGETTLEGRPTIELALRRADGEEETWHLDPETGLEVARRSRGSDYGQPLEQWTYYSDFREVEGLVLPHRIDLAYGIRAVAQTVEAVEVDADVDPGIFALPPSEGMAVLAPLAGDWQVEIETRSGPRAEFTKTQSTSTIRWLVEGNVLEERLTWENQGIPSSVVRTRNWDRFRKVYRFVEVDDFAGYLNVQEGALADGQVTVSNEKTGTTLDAFGQVFHQRDRTFEIGPGGFAVETELSTDGGKTWFVATRYRYQRNPAPPPVGG